MTNETVTTRSGLQMPVKNLHNEGAHKLMAALAADIANPTQLLRRTLTMLYVTGHMRVETQKQLADMLGVSEGRISQIIKAVQPKILREFGEKPLSIKE